jgi:hypothetical protein
MSQMFDFERRLAGLEQARLSSRLQLLEVELLRMNDTIQSLELRLDQAHKSANGQEELETTGAEATAADRRRGERRNVNRVKVRLNQDGLQPAQFEGDIVDYSNQGLGVLVDRYLDTDTLLTLRPPPESRNAFGGGEARPAFEARVRNQRREGNGWRLGCQLMGSRLGKKELVCLGIDN